MVNFRIDGLAEYREKLKLVEKRAPDRIIDKLDKTGNELRKKTREKTPKKIGKIQKGYKLLPVEKVRGGYQKGMTNTAPHFHLVERGHRKVTKSGKEIGWTDGVFMVEKTVREMDETLPGELRDWLNDLFKELSK